jgi:thioredoxin-dependent peroxiredoxin
VLPLFDIFVEEFDMRLISRLALPALLLSAAVLAIGGGLSAGEKSKVKVGDKAPAVQSVDETGKTWKSSDVVGKKVLVLYFYPADFTGGCTKQACGFRDAIEKLGGSGVEVVGVSGDTPATHRAFKKEHNLNFHLLADEHGDVAKAFGIPVSKGGTAKGKNEKGEAADVLRGATIQRYNVVIDKSGHIAAIDKVSNAGGDAERVAALVKSLK